MNFAEEIAEGIPQELPAPREAPHHVNRAPKRRDVLTISERKLALANALRYFPVCQHAILAPEFAQELREHGRIYMFRFRPSYEIRPRPLSEYPYRSVTAGCIMLMISNNLCDAVAQHPMELVTYGGNGSVFQNWAQYRLAMRYLSLMTDEQTLVLSSGHPLGLFPSHRRAPRVVVTNGLVVPNYSKPDDYDRLNALGVSQYGQMTAGSFMYIGPQGIVHGTAITVLNAGRKRYPGSTSLAGRLYVSAGLGGMSGAQGKAASIAGATSVIAEVNGKAIDKRYSQGWIHERYDNLPKLGARIREAAARKEAVSMAYHGNVVDLWEFLDQEHIDVDIGSDQTSLHNPYGGGYYPAGSSFEESEKLIASDPSAFRERVQSSLRRHVAAINRLTARGMYFFDYGNAFLLEASRVGADVMSSNGTRFRYPSYVEDIMGPLCFDYGFGPFRWICSSSSDEDLRVTDEIAAGILTRSLERAPDEIRLQLEDNLHWIEAAAQNNLVVGSKARILYADAEVRMDIAAAFNEAIRSGLISGPIILGRDHHDVSGTDSPYRETADISDGSRFTSDMSVQNVIGDACRGASWVSLHNGGGVGWGEAINGGFGLVLDGSGDADERLKTMLHWDVNNGVARRSWGRNSGAISTINRAMSREPALVVTVPAIADPALIEEAVAAVFDR